MPILTAVQQQLSLSGLDLDSAFLLFNPFEAGSMEPEQNTCPLQLKTSKNTNLLFQMIPNKTQHWSNYGI